ncbi:MAG TPA: response regulator [Burkholderiaceae bacterium]|nr:response regulator [Burkholderiaceae bacterium]
MTSARAHGNPGQPGAPGRAHKVVLLGFGDFERHALASYIRLSTHRGTPFEQVATLAEADFAIADADLPATVSEVRAAARAGDTVFIGSVAPEGALGWSMRPIDPLHVFREFDAAGVLRRVPTAPAPAPTPRDVAAPGAVAAGASARRAEDTAPVPLALLVDDSDVALRFLQRQLHELGLRTETAAHSARALDLLAQRRFDVVFLDVDLGPASDLDGLALCQHLKRRSAGGQSAAGGTPPRVVIVSAHHAPTDRVRGIFAGCDAYLAKPLDDAELRRALAQLGLQGGTDPMSRRRLRDGVPTSGPIPLA